MSNNDNIDLRLSSITFGEHKSQESTKNKIIKEKDLEINEEEENKQMSNHNVINLNINYKKHNNNLELFLNNDNNIIKKNKSNNIENYIIKTNNSQKNISLNKNNKNQNIYLYANSRNKVNNNLYSTRNLDFLSNSKFNKSLDEKSNPLNIKKDQLSYAKTIKNLKSNHMKNGKKKSLFNLKKTRNDLKKILEVQMLKKNKNMNKTTNISQNSSLHSIELPNPKKKNYKNLSNYVNISNLNYTNNCHNKLYNNYIIHENNNKLRKDLNIKKYFSYDKSNENINFTSMNKNSNLINLINNFKTKYEHKSDKIKNEHKDMINEIEILKEKLKLYSEKNSLMQKEIKRLKNQNNSNNISNIKDNNNILKYNNEQKINNNDAKPFQLKLDNIIHKYSHKKNNINDFLQNNKNNDINNIIEKNNSGINNIIINNLDSNNNLVNNLFHIFKLENISFLNKNDFILKENIIKNYDNNIIENNYEKIFENNPQLKYFINVLCDKLIEEKEYREKLEEKTIQIFNNDIKTIDMLEKKLKKYENRYNSKIKDKLYNSAEYNNNTELTEFNNSIKFS